MNTRIKQLTYKNKIYTNPSEIKSILIKTGITWLNKAEIENAIIEIKDDKLYWEMGVWYYGDWIDGVWMDGIFKYGVWHDGVWHNGLWKNGIWKDGTWLNGTFEDGVFEKGEFRSGNKKKGDFKTDVKESVITFTDFFKK